MKNTLSLFVLSLALLFVTACGTDPTLTVTGSPLATAASALVNLPDNLNLHRAYGDTFSGSPTMLKFTVFKFYISANADCTSPLLVSDLGTSGAEVDFYQNPTIITASPANGTYPCMMIEAYDQLTGMVDATAAGAFAGCDSTTEYAGDLYRDGEADDGLWKDSTGTGVDGTGSDVSPGADRVVFFATTDPTAAQNGALGIHSNQSITLTSPLVVPGSAIFYMDFNNGITGDDTRCGIEQGAMGFR